MVKLCILCCYPYQSGGDEDDPTLEMILKGNLQEFCKEVKLDWNGLVNSLENEWNEVLICRDCLDSVDKAVEVRRQVEEMESEVRRLQREILEKMRKLKDFVESWKEELRRLDGIVKEADLGALKSRWRKGRRLQENEDDEVGSFRRRISEVALEAQAFSGDLEVKSEDVKTEVLNEDDSVKIEVKEEDEDEQWDEDNLLDLCEMNLDNQEEETFSEAQKSSNDSDEEETRSEKKDKPRRVPSYKYQISKQVRIALLKSLDTTNWSPIKLRVVTRLLKRNKNSFTAPPPPPQDSHSTVPPSGHNLSYNPATDKLTVNSIEILVKSDSTIPGGGYLQCSLCNYVAKPSLIQKKNVYTDENIDKVIAIHVNGYHLDTYRCPLCLKCLTKPKYYRAHLKRHQGKLNCPDCGKPYSRVRLLRAHQWSHFSEEERQAAVATGEQDPREKRKNSNKTESSFMCATCGKSFMALQYLRQHEETHEESREMIVCPQCGKHILKKRYGNYHRNHCPGSAVDQNRVHCLLCDRRFKTKKILKLHVKRMHSEEGQERNWKCEVCSKGFKSKGNLIMHRKTHEEGQIWTCEKGCGKEFSVKRNWSRHVKGCKGIVK